MVIGAGKASTPDDDRADTQQDPARLSNGKMAQVIRALFEFRIAAS
jgi:hypothetical protein